MSLLHPASSVVTGGCQEDRFVSVGFVEQSLSKKRGIVVGVVVEAVPDGRLQNNIIILLNLKKKKISILMFV